MNSFATAVQRQKQCGTCKRVATMCVCMKGVQPKIIYAEVRALMGRKW